MKTIKKYIVAFLLVLATLNVSAAEAQTETACRKLSFKWGAGFNGLVDLTSHNMSAIGIDAEFGMAWKWIRFLGIGAEGDIMVENSNRTFPIFVNFKTDFSNTDRLVFLDLRGGLAINYFYGNENQTEPYVSGGVGITLAEGKTFSSHIILSYTYLGNKNCYLGDYLRSCPGISLVNLRLGVTF